MAKIEKTLSPEEQAESFIKSNKEDCLNYEKTHDYFVPASSLQLTSELGGGIPPGIHRAIGVATGGKTSQSLDFMFNFFKIPNRRGIYVKAEGRLSLQMKVRSGIIFVTDPKEWKDGTCLILECNIYETIFSFIRNLINNNESEIEYFFILDSLDSMVRKEDSVKGFDEAIKVAGGALLTSVFLKVSSLSMAKKGHIAIFISQVRDEIKINQYEKSNPRQGSSSGGNSIQHGSSIVMNHMQKYNDDQIRENPADKNSKIIGCWAKIQLLKTDNEKNFTTVRYPIKYGRIGGDSVWKEYEVFDMLLMWNLIEKAGSWIKVSQVLIDELKIQNIDIPLQLQGQFQWCKWFEDNPLALKYLYNKFLKMVSCK